MVVVIREQIPILVETKSTRVSQSTCKASQLRTVWPNSKDGTNAVVGDRCPLGFANLDDLFTTTVFRIHLRLR